MELADLCFEAPQCGEKAIKAVFLKHGQSFPFTHDLHKLLRLLEQNGLRVPQYVHESTELTQYAHVTRYPGGVAGVGAALGETPVDGGVI